MNKKGLLLLELALVLTLLGFVALLAVGNSIFLHRLIIRSEIEKLYTICRYLQQCAMIQNKPCTLTFDQEHKKYTYEGHEQILPQQIDFGFLSDAKGPPSSPSSPIGKPITFVNNMITFWPEGIISAGTIYIVDSSCQYMFALTSPISQVSYLRKYQYGDGKWILLE